MGRAMSSSSDMGITLDCRLCECFVMSSSIALLLVLLTCLDGDDGKSRLLWGRLANGLVGGSEPWLI